MSVAQTVMMSDEELAEIVERASTLDERLGEDFVPGEGADAALLDETAERMVPGLRVPGTGIACERRLAFDGLDLERVRRALGPVRLRDGAALPEWSALLAEALRLRSGRADPTGARTRPSLGFLDADHRVPFEEILAPFVLVGPGATGPPDGRLRGTAVGPLRAALERTLLLNLSFASDELLLAEFEAMRARSSRPGTGCSRWPASPRAVRSIGQFVRRMAEGGLVRLFQEYPVLARSLGTIAALWVEANLEFLGRLAADRPEIETHLR